MTWGPASYEEWMHDIQEIEAAILDGKKAVEKYKGEISKIVTHTKTGRRRCCICRDGRRKIVKYNSTVMIFFSVDVPVCKICLDKFVDRNWGTWHPNAIKQAYAEYLKKIVAICDVTHESDIKRLAGRQKETEDG